MIIGPLQSLNDGQSNLSSQIRKVSRSGQIANGSVQVVSWEAVVAPSLNVQSSKIEAGVGGGLVLEQVIGHFLGDELVQGLHGGRGNSSHQVINHTRLVQLVWVEEHVGQLQFRATLGEFVVHPLKSGLEKTVSKPEC